MARKISVTGSGGFVGSTLSFELKRHGPKLAGVLFRHGDIVNSSEPEHFPKIDRINDAAESASVLTGVSGSTNNRPLMKCSLVGTELHPERLDLSNGT